MNSDLLGIHHITAIAGDPQTNIDFYAGVLGLRLVKMTINYDDPGAYHFNYGDAEGTPGSIITFFSWPGARRGRRGASQAVTTTFAVPDDALPYWRSRLTDKGIETTSLSEGDTEGILFEDPDGLRLSIAAAEVDPRYRVWTESDVPEPNAIRGFKSVTLAEKDMSLTGSFLTGTLGFTRQTEAESLSIYTAGQSRLQSVRVEQTDARPGVVAVGSVHHIAWRTPNDASQSEIANGLRTGRVGVSQTMDRQYFKSIYFHEPGGVLFEVATDPPGFTVDEPVESLGSTLRLPEWLEPHRIDIERSLPKVKLP